jgi:hypothetical protein
MIFQQLRLYRSQHRLMNDKLQVMWTWSVWWGTNMALAWEGQGNAHKKGTKLDINSPVHVYCTEYVYYNTIMCCRGKQKWKFWASTVCNSQGWQTWIANTYLFKHIRNKKIYIISLSYLLLGEGNWWLLTPLCTQQLSVAPSWQFLSQRQLAAHHRVVPL